MLALDQDLFALDQDILALDQEIQRKIKQIQKHIQEKIIEIHICFLEIRQETNKNRLKPIKNY